MAGETSSAMLLARTPYAGSGVSWRPPLDALPAAFSAVGLARLLTSYAGPLVRLRRASDNAQQDFSAAANGWVDPAAVAAWAGGNAFIVTRYDQTGNGHDVTQATAGSQAKIATHCRTAICDGTASTASMVGSLAYAQNVGGLTSGSVAISTSVTNDNVLFQINTPVPNTRFRALRLATGGSGSVQSRRLDADSPATSLSTPTNIGSIWHRIIARRDYANAMGTIEIDGGAISSALGTAGSTDNTASPSLMAVESSGASSYWTGETSSHVWFQSALSDANLALFDAALTQIYNGVLAVQ